MTWRRLLSLWCAIPLGCGPSITSPSGEGSSTMTTASASASGSSSGSGSPTASTTLASATVGDSDPSVDGSTTAAMPDIVSAPCDLYDQDCPPGFKCTLWSSDGSPTWNTTGCFPVDPDPVGPGDPCTAQDRPASGYDDCDAQSVCHWVNEDTLEGVCFAFCVEQDGQLGCEQPDQTCLPNSDELGVCHFTCEPLVSMCPPDHVCAPGSSEFVCIPSHWGPLGSLGDPCSLAEPCGPQSICVGEDVVPICGSHDCCLELCALSDFDCISGMACTPWAELEIPPLGVESFGVCTF